MNRAAQAAICQVQLVWRSTLHMRMCDEVANLSLLGAVGVCRAKRGALRWPTPYGLLGDLREAAHGLACAKRRSADRYDRSPAEVP